MLLLLNLPLLYPDHELNGLQNSIQNGNSPFLRSEPLGWIFKINHFSNIHNTRKEQRMSIASFYLDGPTLKWYQWMYNNNQLTPWKNFLHALRIRFAPSQFEDPQGALFKLQQTSTVRDYQTQFEILSDRVIVLSHTFLLSYFILKPHTTHNI